MKIIGGSFGLKGSVYLSRDKRLVIEGATKGIYSADQINKAVSRVVVQKRFGVGGFIVGFLVLSVILFIWINYYGIVVALVLSWLGSSYSDKVQIVDLDFADGNELSVECTPRGVKKLLGFYRS